MRSQILVSLSTNRHEPPRPVNTSWSPSSRHVESAKFAIAASQPGFTINLWSAPVPALRDSVKAQSGLSISRRKFPRSRSSFPKIPARPYLCFYPMDKKRDGADNMGPNPPALR